MMQFTLLSLLALPHFPRVFAASSATSRLQSLPLDDSENFDHYHYPPPQTSIFPGPWEENIQAPANKTHIYPEKLWRWDGDISDPGALLEWTDPNTRSSLSPGGMITLEFKENVAGR